ncbi:integrin beta-2 [Eucyclogobius newberryi]|uniref:integrin beta-2 n=1 Tax=Eucyclogobius newberryi TaxID=166745 RepID=UPI003B5C4E62
MRTALLHPNRRTTLLHPNRRTTLLHPNRRTTLLHPNRRTTLLHPNRRTTLLHPNRRTTLLHPNRRTTLLHPNRRTTLLLLLLLVLSSGVCGQEEVCSRAQIDSCRDCIRAGPFCVWCQQLNFTKQGEQEEVRCDTQAKLRARGCHGDNIITVLNQQMVTKDQPLTQTFDQKDKEPVQLSPQEVRLKLRPGLPVSFPVRFKRVEGYPVDLYYLMDLSFSMNDDLQNVKKLGNELFTALKKITTHGRIGFGTFVDKTVLPYTNTNPQKLLRPCDNDMVQCQAAFGYRHVLSITDREDRFSSEVQKQHISGNLDSPEGSLDAMMQATVCGDQVGWRNSSTRLIVLTTDAGFHMAGDGRLAGILDPNDEHCHLRENLYTSSTHMDYPSVGQLALQLEKQNIQPIFAVTQNVYDIYKDLSKMIPKSEVGILSANSDNVVKLITDAYNRLSSKVTLTHGSLPENLRVTFSPNCDHPGAKGEKTGVCDQVQQGKEISFDVTVVADSCLAPQTFSISPLGIKDTLTVFVEGDCECECHDSHQGATHPHCSDQGDVHCGICRCTEGFLGQFCNCTSDQRAQTASCRQDNGTVCGGRGDCVCGRCHCHAQPSGHFYRGAFCECDDEQCDYHLNKLCAGKGRCICGSCECDAGFEGEACQCQTSRESCSQNRAVCNGRGTCKCNSCVCDSGYLPPLCLLCPSCPDPCQAKLSCVECLGFNIGPFQKNCSVACSSVTHKKVAHLGSARHCELKDSEGCWVHYRLQQLVGRDTYSVEILEERDCPPSLTAIVSASVASVALIGVLLLLLVKLLLYMKDLKEFRKFENEKKKSRWAQADNPLFKNATTTVTNPTFTGE